MSVNSRRILIVDDSPEDRASYRRWLSVDQASAFLFSEAGSGEEGLRLSAELEPVCILLDYQLPDLNGLEFLDRLQSHGDDTTRPAVIMLTGHGNEAVAVEAMKKEAEDYLVKTTDGNRLRQAVRCSH